MLVCDRTDMPGRLPVEKYLALYNGGEVQRALFREDIPFKIVTTTEENLEKLISNFGVFNNFDIVTILSKATSNFLKCLASMVSHQTNLVLGPKFSRNKNSEDNETEKVR